METETITQARILILTVIIIHVQDVTMEVVQVLELQLRRVEIQIHHRLNKQHRGETIVIRVRLQHLLHQIIVHRGVVHRVVGLLLAVVHRAVVVLVAEVEAEVQDKINKTLTRKSPQIALLRGFFRLKYRGTVIFNCHICSYILILHHFLTPLNT